MHGSLGKEHPFVFVGQMTPLSTKQKQHVKINFVAFSTQLTFTLKTWYHIKLFILNCNILEDINCGRSRSHEWYPPPPILPHPSLPLYPACSHNRVQFRNKFHFLKHGKVWSWRIYTHHCTSFFRKRVSAPSIVRRREAVQFIPSWIFKKWYLFLLLSYTHYTCIYQDSYARIVRINFITSIIKMAIIKIVIKNTNRMQKQWKWTYWNLLPWLLKLEF